MRTILAIAICATFGLATKAQNYVYENPQARKLIDAGEYTHAALLMDSIVSATDNGYDYLYYAHIYKDYLGSEYVASRLFRKAIKRIPKVDKDARREAYKGRIETLCNLGYENLSIHVARRAIHSGLADAEIYALRARSRYDLLFSDILPWQRAFITRDIKKARKMEPQNEAVIWADYITHYAQFHAKTRTELLEELVDLHGEHEICAMVKLNRYKYDDNETLKTYCKVLDISTSLAPPKQFTITDNLAHKIRTQLSDSSNWKLPYMLAVDLYNRDIWGVKYAEYLKQSIDIEPQARTCISLALALELGFAMPEEAVKLVDKAIELNPEALSITDKASTLMRFNRFEEAYKLVEERLKDHPYDHDALVVGTICLTHLRRWEDVKRMATRAMAQDDYDRDDAAMVRMAYVIANRELKEELLTPTALCNPDFWRDVIHGDSDYSFPFSLYDSCEDEYYEYEENHGSIYTKEMEEVMEFAWYGENTLAIQAMKKVLEKETKYRSYYNMSIRIDPIFYNLHGDPRFEELVSSPNHDLEKLFIE